MYPLLFRRSSQSTDYFLSCEECLSSTQSYLSAVASAPSAFAAVQDADVKSNARRLSPVLLEMEFKNEGWPRPLHCCCDAYELSCLLSSRIFVALDLKFLSLTCFAFDGIRQSPNFVLLHVDIQIDFLAPFVGALAFHHHVVLSTTP